MHKLWVIKEQKKELQEKLASQMNISPVLAQLLINRNLIDPGEIEKFLHCKKSFLHDPLKLKDISRAVDRVKKAIARKEKMLIFGDYDADGITSVALLFTFLKKMGADADWYLPNRLEDGYGLNKDAVEFAKSKGQTLVITVDCGTTDKDEVALLNSYNIDTIIIDHHEVQPELLPAAYAMINPMQPDCSYPFKELSGVGLAYKFACAMSGDNGHLNEEYLDLVALGTVADVVPQTGENRILTRLGLIRLSNTSRLGIRALIEAAGLRAKDIQAEHIGFVLGPRINVGGRIGSPEIALKLLLSENKDEAAELAQVLNQENSFRQRLQEGIFKEAVAKIEGRTNFKDTKVIVVDGSDWHPGVIGIVASKIADRFYRPTIVFSLGEDTAKGSGRSIDNFNLFEAVYECRGLLENFGGHEAACGITIAKTNIEKFRDRINTVAAKMLKEGDLIPKVEVDAEVPLSCINKKFIDELKLLEPFGAGNPAPLFLSTNLRLKDRPKQFGRSGMRMWVTDTKVTCEATCFNASDMMSRCQDLSAINMVYSPKIREISGIGTLKLEIEDLKTH